jgi:8-oxo-dGTP pyrophosphatase MutT (NUDIX family)
MAHIHEKIDFTASVYIVNGDAVFLHLHQKVQKWLPAGGHIELDEDPNQAVCREAREETGLDIELVGNRPNLNEAGEHTELLAPRFMNRHLFQPNDTHEHVDLVYFGRAKNRDVRSEGGAEYRWFTKDDLEDPSYNLLPAIRFYAKGALDAAEAVPKGA